MVYFFSVFSRLFFVVLSSFTLAANVSGLCEVADFGTQMFSFALKFIRITAIDFTTKPAILPNACSSDTFGECSNVPKVVNC